MNYNYIVNPLKNIKCDIHSCTGQKILNQYLIQEGGACICGAEGVTKTTCPQNPWLKIPNQKNINDLLFKKIEKRHNLRLLNQR